MIVCLCRGVSDRQIIEAVRCGARSLDEVSRRCDGAGGDCGSCQEDIACHLGGGRFDERAA
jgi:bacterioferritin-associated ferredoxin